MSGYKLPNERGFIRKTHPTFLVHSLIWSFLFLKILFQNLIIPRFLENCLFWLTLCFVQPHYAGDLAALHCRQIFQNIPFFIAVPLLSHVLLQCVMPPTVTLRKGSHWRHNCFKSQMCIPHRFDFNAKFPQLSCFWDLPDVRFTVCQDTSFMVLWDIQLAMWSCKK